MKKSILFINQSSGYLMIDIVNAHAPYYDELILHTGFLSPRNTPLNSKVKVEIGVTYQRSSSIKRLITWFGFWLQSLFYIFIKYRSHNLYFVSNPPINIFTARWLKRDFAYLVYDIYPEILAINNIMSNKSWFYKYWESVNQSVYRKAKKIFTLNDSMAKTMKIQNKYNAKLELVPLWTSNKFFKNIQYINNNFIKKYKIQDKFIVTYSGNLGKTHPVEKLIELADSLVNEKNILFLIIGDGDKKEKLLQQQKKLKLPNLEILDFQPTNLFAHVLSATKLGVVTLEANATDLSVPSKTFDLMSAGKPILSISSKSSELANIIKSNNIGENFDEDEIEKMRNFILDIKNNQKKYHYMHKQSKKTSLKFSPENAKRMILR